MNNKPIGGIQGNETMIARSENERRQVESREKISGNDASVEISLKKKYEAVSKNGDTLELSDTGKTIGKYADTNISSDFKKVISDSGKKISDSTLLGYSESKLRQLFAQKAITKQQYDKVIKQKNQN